MKTSGFQSTPSGGKATCDPPAAQPADRRFNPRLPGGRRLVGSSQHQPAQHCFNPRLPGGRRQSGPYLLRPAGGFNPRLPGGRRLIGAVPTSARWRFQSTPSGGKATLTSSTIPTSAYVSIHAFRGEGDQTVTQTISTCRRFQSTPSGGKATLSLCRDSRALEFQSTPSGGKATASRIRRMRCVLCFNPRLPGGRRLNSRRFLRSQPSVSIHAFRGEGDR